MQFRILRTELLNALTKVSRAVSSKSPLPVLTGIKFNLTNDELILQQRHTQFLPAWLVLLSVFFYLYTYIQFD